MTKLRPRGLSCGLLREKMTKEQLKQQRYDSTYIKMATEWSGLSHCDRKQVGAIIVKDGMIIADGYNGTPSGFDNCCEDHSGETHWYVLHAEANAILKLARSNNSAEGATLYSLFHPVGIVQSLFTRRGL